MKIITLCSLLIGVLFNLNSVDIGDTIDSLIQNYSYKYPVNQNHNFPDFNEIQLVRFQYIEKMKAPMLLTAYQDNDLLGVYGVLDGTSEKSWYLFDFNGDGILDFKSDVFFYPNWILFKSDIKRDSIDKFLDLTFDLYSEFNKLDGPNNDNINKIIQQSTEYSKNQNIDNRDCYYSIYSYFIYLKNNLPIYGNVIINNLLTHLEEYKFDKRLVGILLFSAESDIAVERNDHAKKTFEMIKMLDNESIIADFYLADLSAKYENNNKLLEDFYKRNNNFWIKNK